MKNNDVINADYLATRTWFCYNNNLQDKIFHVIMKDRGHLIDVVHGDFEEHINSLLT